MAPGWEIYSKPAWNEQTGVAPKAHTFAVPVTFQNRIEENSCLVPSEALGFNINLFSNYYTVHTAPPQAGHRSRGPGHTTNLCPQGLTFYLVCCENILEEHHHGTLRLFSRFFFFFKFICLL